MLPKVKYITDRGAVCGFMWLNAEAYGPVDPTCGSDARVFLIGSDDDREPRCFHHAAHEIALAMCTELEISVRWTQPQFGTFVEFLESFLADVIAKEKAGPVVS